MGTEQVPGAEPERADVDQLRHDGPVRTDLNCTNCQHNFVAVLDYSLDGNHIVECPYCRHEHCRVIEGGRVTEERWSTRHQRVDVDRHSVWKCGEFPIQTNIASEFIRQRWLNRSDAQ